MNDKEIIIKVKKWINSVPKDTKFGFVDVVEGEKYLLQLFYVKK